MRAPAPSPEASSLPRRRLLALTLAVLAAHAWVLGPGIDAWRSGDPTPGQTAVVTPLHTRLLPLVSAPPQTPVPSPTKAQHPDVRRRPPVRRPTAVPAPPDAPDVAAAYPENPPPAQDIHEPEAINSIASASPPALPSPSPPTPQAPEPPTPAPEVTSKTAATPATGPSQDDSGRMPAQVAPPMRLSFKLMGQARRLPYHASGEMTWVHDGANYEARAVISAFLVGSRSQSSQGLIGPDGLRPRRFGDRTRSELAAHFDPDAGRVSFSANTPDVAWQAGMQDRLSVFMQLAAMVHARPEAYVAGTQITVPTVGPKDAETWQFVVDGPESLDLPIGPTEALKLSRPPRHEYDTRIEIWLAPAWHHLPARIRISQANGDFADQQLREAQPVQR